MKGVFRPFICQDRDHGHSFPKVENFRKALDVDVDVATVAYHLPAAP